MILFTRDNPIPPEVFFSVTNSRTRAVFSLVIQPAFSQFSMDLSANSGLIPENRTWWSVNVGDAAKEKRQKGTIKRFSEGFEVPV